MSTLDLTALQERLRAFAGERDWDRFHSPKNLAMALSVEVAELVEIFQWLTEDESLAAADDEGTQNALSDELADIVIYAVRIADIARIDLAAAIPAKIAKNALKHPPAST